MEIDIKDNKDSKEHKENKEEKKKENIVGTENENENENEAEVKEISVPLHIAKESFACFPIDVMIAINALVLSGTWMVKDENAGIGCRQPGAWPFAFALISMGQVLFVFVFLCKYSFSSRSATKPLLCLFILFSLINIPMLTGIIYFFFYYLLGSCSASAYNSSYACVILTILLVSCFTKLLLFIKFLFYARRHRAFFGSRFC